MRNEIIECVIDWPLLYDWSRIDQFPAEYLSCFDLLASKWIIEGVLSKCMMYVSFCRQKLLLNLFLGQVNCKSCYFECIIMIKKVPRRYSVSLTSSKTVSSTLLIVIRCGMYHLGTSNRGDITGNGCIILPQLSHRFKGRQDSITL